LRGKIEPFKQDESWQSEINEAKKVYAGKSKLELCSELADEDLEKQRLDAELHSCNTRREALNQLLLEIMEAAGDTSIRNSFGTFYLQDSPYSKVADKSAYLSWIRAQGLEELLSVPYQTTNAQVSERLQAGEQPPPGVEVYLKSSVRRRQA
jgi:hypothetical protein